MFLQPRGRFLLATTHSTALTCPQFLALNPRFTVPRINQRGYTKKSKEKWGEMSGKKANGAATPTAGDNGLKMLKILMLHGKICAPCPLAYLYLL